MLMLKNKFSITIIIVFIQIVLVLFLRAVRPINPPFENEPHKILGNPNAKINLVVFSEILCPYCIDAHGALKQIVEKYKDLVKVTYKHYLLRGNQPYNITATMALECAGDQNRFWDYYERITAAPSEWFDHPDYKDHLKRYAQDIGLNQIQFSACFDQDQKLSVIQANHNEGKAYLVQGTPTGYLNGDRIILNFKYEYLDALIKAELEKNHRS